MPPICVNPYAMDIDQIILYFSMALFVLIFSGIVYCLIEAILD
jgi:hypothetical protein